MAKRLGILKNDKFIFDNYQDWQINQATEDKIIQKLKDDNGVPAKFEWNKTNRHKYFYSITFSFNNYGPIVNHDIPDDEIWVGLKPRHLSTKSKLI